MADMEELKIRGVHDEKTIKQMQTCIETGLLKGGYARGVLCADGHLGYAQPVGGVVAYRDHISISGVGYDIGCGNKAVKTDIRWIDIQKQQAKIADEIARSVSFGIGRVNKEKVDHELFDDPAWKLEALRGLKNLGRDQLGTIGSGNHYVDLLTDESGWVWIGVHFGSRGLGHKTASHFLLVAGGRDGMNVPPTLVHTSSSIGADYHAAMELAGKYAYAGRDYVCDLVVNRILQGRIVESVHNHHNFAWLEEHDGEKVWVIRKGATPAFPGQRGFVGGSMGDISVILKGVDSPESKEILYSTVHGAGRVMSRTQAAGKCKWLKDEKTGKKVKTRVAEGLVNEASMRQKIKNAGIELRGGGADEAPEVYRPLADVLAHHAGTIEIEHTLSPKIVIMAGADEHDPFRD